MAVNPFSGGGGRGGLFKLFISSATSEQNFMELTKVTSLAPGLCLQSAFKIRQGQTMEVLRVSQKKVYKNFSSAMLLPVPTYPFIIVKLVINQRIGKVDIM